MELLKNYLWYYKKLDKYIIFIYPKNELEIYNINKLDYSYSNYRILDIRLLLSTIANKDTEIIEAFLSNSKTINYEYKNILDNLFNYKELIVFGENKEIQEEMKECIKNIIIYLINNAKEENIDYNDLFSTSELKALLYIHNKIKLTNLEGDINIKQSSLETSISTPVFRNLLYKLKENNMAKIDSRGVKGTHIKFISSMKWIENISNK